MKPCKEAVCYFSSLESFKKTLIFCKILKTISSKYEMQLEFVHLMSTNLTEIVSRYVVLLVRDKLNV